VRLSLGNSSPLESPLRVIGTYGDLLVSGASKRTHSVIGQFIYWHNKDLICRFFPEALAVVQPKTGLYQA
jgi:hypothetical protein